MKQLILIGFLGLFTLSACTDNVKEENSENHKTKQEVHKEHVNHQATVQLNDGEKWIANIETTTNIEKMVAIVNSETKDGDLTYYHTIGERLDTEMQTVFSECTMKGESHEQLHNYLLPLVKLINELKDAENLKEAHPITEKINNHLNNYSTYFK
ncbi:MAG: hypothetical protein JKX68_06680 [Flavobacteriales bacterium]|nr:hypothetical protein [Flavobacteriales bacterium]